MKLKQKCVQFAKWYMENRRRQGQKNGYLNYYKRIIKRHPELATRAEGEK